MKGGVVVAVLVVVGSGLFSLPASAQGSDAAARAAARKLGNEGVAAYQAEHYDVASKKLEKAFAMLRAPSLALWSARSLVKQDKLLEAVERYLETSRLTVSGGDVEVQKRAQADAATEADATQALIPSIVIQVEGAAPADVTLRVDGAAVSSQLTGDAMPVNPGAHDVEVSFGAEVVSGNVTVQRKEQKRISLTLHGSAQRATAVPVAEPPNRSVPVEGQTNDPAPSNLRGTLAWTALGAGVGGLLVGGIAGSLAAGKRSSLDHNAECADHTCPASFDSDVSKYNSFRTVSTVGFVVGGALCATGGLLLLTQPHTSTQSSASLWLTPAGVALRGRFQ